MSRAAVNGPFHYHLGDLHLHICSPSIVRVVYGPMQRPPGHESLMVPPQAWPTYAVRVEENQGPHSVLQTDALEIRVDTSDGALTFLARDGRNLLREPRGGGRGLSPSRVGGLETRQAHLEFVPGGDEAFYGLGQTQTGLFNYRGHVIPLEQQNTVLATPFFYSTRGYGLLFDHESYGECDFGASKADRVCIKFEAADALEFYFIYGPGPDAVMAGYRAVTGATPLPPRWALGFWESRERFKTQEEILQVARRFRAERIPVDVIVQDWKYWGRYPWSSMQWDPEIFPDPEGMIREIHALNMRVVVSVWPRLEESHPPFRSPVHDELAAGGHMLNKPWCESYRTRGSRHPNLRASAYYNVFDPDARACYWRHLRRAFFDIGADGLWFDSPEPEFQGSVRERAVRFQLGVDGGPIRFNSYSIAHSRGAYEGHRAMTDRRRVCTLTRSFIAGQQRYATIVWNGDVAGTWNVFRRQIAGGLNFALSGGCWWTTDIGGIIRPKRLTPHYRELYLRWFQFAAFSPIFRAHGSDRIEHEPWCFDEEAQSIMRFYLRLRYRLLPYLYSLAWQVTQSNRPMMRPLIMDFPEDPAVREIADQFMLGPALMVAPVTQAMFSRLGPDDTTGWKGAEDPELVARQQAESAEGEAERQPVRPGRSVYLPAGADWVDFWTGLRHCGGGTVEVDTPLDRIPLFIRAGSIVPMGPDLQYTEEKPADPIELYVYPGADGTFTLYEDAGDSYDYEHGAHTLIPLSWNDAAGIMRLDERRGCFAGMLDRRTFRIRVVENGRALELEPAASGHRDIAYTGSAQRG